MLRYILFALVLDAGTRGLAQPATAQSATPTDARNLLTDAAAYYDLSSENLKPWHLRATYRLYDLAGNPSAEGPWEYWWLSPKVHRRTWTRAGAERTDWYTAEGALYRKESGTPLTHFERTIEGELISPLPPKSLVDSGRIRLDLKMLPAGSGQLACAISTFQWIVDGKAQAPSSGMQPYYCFDLPTLALRMVHSESVTTEFNRIVKTQGRYLAQEMTVSIGKVNVFSVSVEKIEGISSTNAALTPASDAVPVLETVSQPSGDQVATGLVKKTQPVYPITAKSSHIQGTVVLAATIGKAGKIRDLEVLASPASILTASALDAVKRWEYKPHLLNGAPVEVDTLVNVIFSLSP